MEFYHGRNALLYLWHSFLCKLLGLMLRFAIYPDAIGPVLKYHTGDFVHIVPNVCIGKNCRLLPSVVFCNKSGKAADSQAIVGDNCYLALGVKIFGSIRIGNNLPVWLNAVVTKVIPYNAVVGGVPAKIQKIKVSTYVNLGKVKRNSFINVCVAKKRRCVA